LNRNGRGPLFCRVAAVMRPDGPLAALRDVAGKAAEQAGRIAGVLQIVDDVSARAVEADAMTRACELATWYLNEAARLASESLVPPVVRDAQTLLAWLHGRHMTTVSDRREPNCRGR
jgi:Protein of unknown function (DUF3987)